MQIYDWSNTEWRCATHQWISLTQNRSDVKPVKRLWVAPTRTQRSMTRSTSSMWQIASSMTDMTRRAWCSNASFSRSWSSTVWISLKSLKSDINSLLFRNNLKQSRRIWLITCLTTGSEDILNWVLTSLFLKSNIKNMVTILYWYCTVIKVSRHDVTLLTLTTHT